MFTAYDNLQATIDISKITKITLDELELDVNKTLALMKEIKIEDIFSDLTIWTKTSRFDRITEYDEFGDTQTYFQEIKLKPEINKKVIPESLKELWEDPETGERLPLKTKAYLKEEKKREERRQQEIEESKRKNYERAKNLIEEKLEEVETFEFEPFTIIEGGEFNRCRYITLPESFPVPRNGYFLDNEAFYKKHEKTKTYVDFVGLAGMKNAKAQILFGYGSDSLNGAKDLKDLVNKAIKENKFTPVVGISQEIIGGKDLDIIIQEIKEELENEYSK